MSRHAGGKGVWDELEKPMRARRVRRAASSSKPSMTATGSWSLRRPSRALGELTDVFGVHIARIPAQNGLDIEEELARILPASDAETDRHPGRKSARKKLDPRSD